MLNSMRCLICGEIKRVNGQRQISEFTGNHLHGDSLAGITAKNVVRDDKQDRITLKIDPVPLMTGKY